MRIKFYLLQDMGYFWSRFITNKINFEEKPLEINEILERLCIKDKDVIETIYSIYYDSLEREDKRRSDLDSKAFSLIGIAGVCITLLFGLGGILIEKIKIPYYVTILTILYLGAFLFGAISLLFALFATMSRSDFKTINEEDIFEKNQINENILTYKRFLTAHYWQVQRNDYRINEEKGRFLKIAFRMFFCTVIYLLIIVCLISSYLLTQGGSKMSSSDKREKPQVTAKPTDGKIETANDKPKPTPRPSAGENLTESKGK